MSTAVLEKPASTSTIVPVGDDELYEVIDGQRVRTPPIGVFAVWTAFRLAKFLDNFAEENLGRAITEALFHLPAPINRDRRPDVAFVSYGRWAKDRPIPATDNAWDIVPNLATEVVSPTDSVEELEQKIAEYFRAGVQMVWVVHPTRSKVHVYHSPTQITVLSKNETLDGGTVVPGFQLALAELFTPATETPVVSNARDRHRYHKSNPKKNPERPAFLRAFLRYALIMARPRKDGLGSTCRAMRRSM